MANHLWNGADNTSGMKTYKTYENAVKRANEVLCESSNIRFLIVSDGERFFPVAIGEEAFKNGIQFHMAVTF